MELLSGFPLFFQQVRALLRKNYIIAWKSRKTTLLRLLSPLLFIGFMFALKKTGDDGRSLNFSEAVRNQQAFFIPSIPACENKMIIKTPCYDFVWSGSGNQKIESIVNGIMANNPGRRIHQSKVKAFRTKDELNDWLMQNPMRTPGALHFNGDNDGDIRYGIAINSSSSRVRIGRQGEDPVFSYQLPLQNAVLREMSRSLIGDPEFSFDVGLKEFDRPRTTTDIAGINNSNSILVAFQVLFFLAIAMFSFITQIHSVVLEKELKLRQTMTVMGLYDVAYWTSWFVWEGFMAFLTSLIIVAFGAMFRVDLFVKNNAVISFLLFFLFMLSMVAVALAISTLLKNSSSTTSVGFFVLILGTVTSVFSILFYFEDVKKLYRILWSLFPVNPFSGGLSLLQSVSDDEKGLSWSDVWKCQTNSPCMSYFFSWLVATFFLWTLLAIYLDNILPNSAGVRKQFFYFLMPSYWTGKEQHIQVGLDSLQQMDRSSVNDEDVQEEEEAVKKAAKEGVIDPEVAVQLRAFSKSYPKTTKLSFHKFCFCLCCCKCKTTKPFNAVKNFWMNFPRNQLFCLLGPNGAGKSTLISCLTGIIPVTSGDAIVYGNSVRSSSGMARIRKMIGVTAQFDSLWDDLSGIEHLRLFASVKGLPPAIHQGEVNRLLADVDLVKAGNVRAGSYSGGMRRRLSLAIALIGDPKLLILDEPTTGMDPITQRRVWDVIQTAKQGRSIILTTHSMVEADVLSDRIGIMGKGRLRCIGTSTVLKTRFGSGYTAKVSFPREASNTNEEQREAVKLYFKNGLNVEPKGENSYSLTFTLPNAGEEILAGFFSELESRVNELGIKNIQLGLGTLEEVFLNVVKKAELETADSKEKYQTLTLPSGVTVPVAIGEKWVTIPGTETAEYPRGLMVEVFWEQDASGNLCISSFSAEKPVGNRV